MTGVNELFKVIRVEYSSRRSNAIILPLSILALQWRLLKCIFLFLKEYNPFVTDKVT